MEHLEIFIRYLIRATDKINEDELQAIVVKTAHEGGERIMPTIAERWVEKGIEKGIQKGLLEGIRAGLEVKFSQAGLSLYPSIAKIENTGMLRSIHKVILKAKDVKEVRKAIEGMN